MAIFLNIPGIEGDALDKTHDKWINIDQLAHSLEVTNQSGASRARRGHAMASAISLTKTADSATTELQQALTGGREFPKVTIDLTRNMGTGPVVYLQYELTNVVVTSWSLQSFDDTAVESFELSFGSIETTFTTFSEKGKDTGSTEFGFNFETNEATV